jgi:hypothetical protein
LSSNLSFPPRASKISDADARNLCNWGVLDPAPRSSVRRRRIGFAFKVPKADAATSRLVVDDPDNLYCVNPPHFHILSPRQNVSLVMARPYGVSYDAVNWFFQIPLPLATRWRHCIRVGSRVYWFRVLSMGWRWAPWIAHVLTSALSSCPVTKGGGTSSVIIDNTLITAPSISELKRLSSRFEERAAMAGVTLGETPIWNSTSGRSFTHSGIRFSSQGSPSSVEWALKEGWAHRFHHLTLSLLAIRRPIPLEIWEKAIGMVVWFVRVLDAPLLILRPLLGWLADVMRRARVATAGRSLSQPRVLPWTEAASVLQRVSSLAAIDPWVRRRPIPSEKVVLWTDASMTGWGAVTWLAHHQRSWQGKWASRPESMPLAEALASWFAIRRVLTVSSSPILIVLVTDCMPWYHALRRMYSPAPLLSRVLSDIFSALLKHGSSLVARWVDTAGQLADAPSRGEQVPEFGKQSINEAPQPGPDEIPLPTTELCPSSSHPEASSLLLSAPAPQHPPTARSRSFLPCLSTHLIATISA